MVLKMVFCHLSDCVPVLKSGSNSSLEFELVWLSRRGKRSQTRGKGLVFRAGMREERAGMNENS